MVAVSTLALTGPRYYDSSRNDLQEALYPLVTFGKIIGVVPLSNAKFRWNLMLIVFLLINVTVDIYGTCKNAARWRTPLNVAQSIGSPTFFMNGFFIYYHMNRHIERLYEIYREWKACERLHKKRDRSLYRFVNIWSGLIFTSAISENFLFHFKLCPPYRSRDPFLRCIFYAFGGYWPQFFYASEFLGIYHILTNKLALYAWNFMDLFIMSLSRAIYFQFDAIGQTVRTGKESWSTLHVEFVQAVKLLKITEEFLSPMVFASYGLNTYALCMQLNLWLTPTRNRNAYDSAYALWSSLHLIARVLLVSISAANINASATKVVDQIRMCPEECYNTDLQRLEDLVTSTPMGLTGLRCFTITRGFILTLISVVFTFEVVLLQSFAASLHGHK